MRVPASVIKRIKNLEDARNAKPPPPFFDANFPEQRSFIEDVAQLIVVLCTRRAGKSFAAALRLLRACFRHPGSSCLFIGLTRESAKKILWKDCLKVINRRWKLKAKFNEAKLTMTLPNGSVIYLLGADTDEDERQKLLGQKYAEVCIDEAASYTIDLQDLVFSVLKPAVADYRGNICLLGTPGVLKSGLFFDLTADQDPREPGTWSRKGWSGHRWTAFQNPHIRKQWQEEIDALVAADPLIVETPAFQQNYYGVWVIDESKLVYRYSSERNDFEGLPANLGRGTWHYALGIDLGFSDATSFTVAAFHDNSNTLFFVESFKKKGLDITATAEESASIKTRYSIETVVIDGANRQAVEELNRRHGLEARPADKREKAEFIDMMNAEYTGGRIKLSPECSDLKEELSGLIWDQRALARGQRKEHASCQNHCTDGSLYTWRYCYQWLYVAPKPPPPRMGTVEYALLKAANDEAEEARYIERAEAEARARKREERELEEWLS